MKKYLISSNIFKRKAQFALWTITGNFIIFIHRIACLKRNFTSAHVLQTCGAMFHWLSRKDYMSFELNGNTQSKCTRSLTDVYIFRNRNCETSHASTSVTAQSMGIKHKPSPSACFREEAVQEGSWSVSSGVGSGPWPSHDVDLGFIIQLLHDSLLFDRQDGVADWTTTLKENTITL